MKYLMLIFTLTSLTLSYSSVQLISDRFKSLEVDLENKRFFKQKLRRLNKEIDADIKKAKQILTKNYKGHFTIDREENVPAYLKQKGWSGFSTIYAKDKTGSVCRVNLSSGATDNSVLTCFDADGILFQ